MKITLVGSFPPPFGGISVHIKKLKNQLKIAGYGVEVLDISTHKPNEQTENVYYYNKGSKLKSLISGLIHLMFSKSNIVHFHTSAFGNFIYVGPAMLIFSGFKKKIITIHSGSFVEEASKFNPVKKKMLAFILKKLDHIIAVNKDQLTYLNECFKVDAKKITVIPAYIAEEVLIHELDPIVKEKVINLKKTYNKVIVTSGNKVDYYGHHHTLNALFGISEDTAIVFCFYEKFDETYSEKINLMKESYPNAYFINNLSPNEFAFLLSNSDIYVRSTDRDGDAVAIREAKHYGLDIIATNCVKRPKGTYLYEFGNYKELNKLLNYCIEKEKKPEGDIYNNGFMDIYSTLLNEL